MAPHNLSFPHSGVFTHAQLDCLSALCGCEHAVLDGHLHDSPVSFLAPNGVGQITQLYHFYHGPTPVQRCNQLEYVKTPVWVCSPFRR